MGTSVSESIAVGGWWVDGSAGVSEQWPLLSGQHRDAVFKELDENLIGSWMDGPDSGSGSVTRLFDSAELSESIRHGAFSPAFDLQLIAVLNDLESFVAVLGCAKAYGSGSLNRWLLVCG